MRCESVCSADYLWDGHSDIDPIFARRVPLDYFDPSAGKAKIALARYNATVGPRKGSLFVNPGGPGGSGVSLVTHAGSYLQHLVSTIRSGSSLFIG